MLASACAMLKHIKNVSFALVWEKFNTDNILNIKRIYKMAGKRIESDVQNPKQNNSIHFG